MKNFNFIAPTKILFGKNKVNELGNEIKQHGTRVLFAYGTGSIKKTGLYDKVVEQLTQAGIEYFELDGIKPNPDISSVREGIKICRENNVDFVLAVGGGSVIDCSKAVAAGVPYAGDAWDFLMRKAAVKNPLPVGTILTLAATGSEMNGNSVISNKETGEKRAFGDDSLRPKFSILDPVNTFTVNKWQTAAGTVDIISHIFEQYFTPDKGTFVQDAIAEGIVNTCVKYGPVALEEPENYEARANLMWSSSLALNGLTGTGKIFGDWATHDIEHELSAYNDLTHGAGLAILFPVWLEYVLDEIRAIKIARMSRSCFGVTDDDDMQAAKNGIKAIRNFFTSLGMPATLTEVNITAENFDHMAESACRFGPLGMFKKLGPQQVKDILNMAL
ncbi:MAG: iron-containing alcohol dehydrogenase [Chlorobi bacterium]|nr:iron-containing alcohol dehydrogenase [Chlorobiota bacterium]